MLQVLLALLLVLPSELHGACPGDWKEYTDDYCYKEFKSSLSWDKARESCMGKNSVLADIRDKDENEFVRGMFGGNNWLGLCVCKHKEGKPTLVPCDENSMEINWDTLNASLNLMPEYPDSTVNNYAVVIQADGSWVDQFKMEKFPYICKQKQKVMTGCAGGDPHYETFDGKKYDFFGKCEYILAKDCGSDHAFEILQHNEPCGGVSCAKSLRVLFHGMEVQMERKGIVYVDGVRVNIPWTHSGSETSITKTSSGTVLNVPDLLFSVTWDGSMYIKVEINQIYDGNMCGLLGNADGNSDNDFQLPDRSFTSDITKFGNSWKKNPRCNDGNVPPDPCKKLTQLENKEIKEKCRKMKQPPFKQCNEKITPDIGYIPNCEYDLCAMKENPSAAWCEALENYDKTCASKGVNIDWEGKAGFEECGSPCAKMPCFNDAKCENINRKQFKCICPSGFSGPTCENVECKSGYIARGSLCYKMMTKSPWRHANCPEGNEFMSAEDEDENIFIYEKFVKPLRKSIWMNAYVCKKGKLCAKDFTTDLYHNFVGQFPANGCVEMRYGKNGMWMTEDCETSFSYICKYEKFSN